mmetsp:Transcript_15435/g.27043  ORF Transcript_15435/g.27043 Transcript_15435/m.27043 type:complete len:488 (-) Transcript_15435:61-1524(-)
MLQKICLCTFLLVSCKAVSVSLDSRAEIRREFQRGRCAPVPTFYEEDVLNFDPRAGPCAFRYYFLQFHWNGTPPGTPWRFAEMKLYTSSGPIPTTAFDVDVLNASAGTALVSASATAKFGFDNLLETDVDGGAADAMLRIDLRKPIHLTKYTIVSSSTGTEDSDPTQWSLWGNADGAFTKEMAKAHAVELSSVTGAYFPGRNWMCDPPFFAALGPGQTCHGPGLSDLPGGALDVAGGKIAYYLGCFVNEGAQALKPNEFREDMKEMQMKSCAQAMQATDQFIGMESLKNHGIDGFAACLVAAVPPNLTETANDVECENSKIGNVRLGAVGRIAMYVLAPWTTIRLFEDADLSVTDSGTLRMQAGDASSKEKWNVVKVTPRGSFATPYYNIKAIGRGGTGQFLGTDGKEAKLFHADEGNGCQRWTSEEVLVSGKLRYLLKVVCKLRASESGSGSEAELYLGMDPSFNVVVDDKHDHTGQHAWLLEFPE